MFAIDPVVGAHGLWPRRVSTVWGLEFTPERVGSQKEQVTCLCGREVLGLGPLPYPAFLREVRHLARAARCTIVGTSGSLHSLPFKKAIIIVPVSEGCWGA